MAPSRPPDNLPITDVVCVASAKRRRKTTKQHPCQASLSNWAWSFVSILPLETEWEASRRKTRSIRAFTYSSRPREVILSRQTFSCLRHLPPSSRMAKKGAGGKGGGGKPYQQFDMLKQEPPAPALSTSIANPVSILALCLRVKKEIPSLPSSPTRISTRGERLDRQPIYCQSGYPPSPDSPLPLLWPPA